MGEPSEHKQSICLHTGADVWMQTLSRRNVGLAPEKPGRGLLDAYQLKQSKSSLFIIKKQVNIGARCLFSSRGRSEQVKVSYAHPLQIGLMLAQPRNGRTLGP